jgi:hypothetical protein
MRMKKIMLGFPASERDVGCDWGRSPVVLHDAIAGCGAEWESVA